MDELVLKTKEGDVESYTQLMLKIKNNLYKICKTRLTNDDDIDDVIQETMIQTYNQIHKLRDIKKFKPWIITILINNCNKIYRKKQKDQIIIEKFNIQNKESINPINATEDDINFYFLLKDLKYEERLIIILYYSEHFTFKEISNILNINENTIKTRLYRTKEKIRINYKGGIKLG